MLWLFKDVKHFQGRGKDQVNGSLANQLPRFVVERSVIPIPFPHVSCWPACELYPTSYQANYLMKQLRGPSRAAETSNFQDTHPLFEPLSTGQLPKSHSAKTFIKIFSYVLSSWQCVFVPLLIFLICLWVVAGLGLSHFYQPVWNIGVIHFDSDVVLW